MRKVIDYKLVTDTGFFPIEHEVKELIKDGWQPWGNASVSIMPGHKGFGTKSKCVQAMVLYEEEDE